jgi:cytochrome c oxidase subunit 3
MNTTTTILAATGGGDVDPVAPRSTSPGRPGAVAATGLWVFMGVATMLFTMLTVAYVLRLDGVDGYPLALPWQLWFSTALLAAGGVALQQAGAAARRSHRSNTHSLLLAGGTCALAFVAVQFWAWGEMQAARVVITGNPAGTFFYLLTAVHSLHVAGGLGAWALTVSIIRGNADLAAVAWRIELCARYWHFLLLVWVALFAMMASLTPELVRVICSVLKPSAAQ